MSVLREPGPVRGHRPVRRRARWVAGVLLTGSLTLAGCAGSGGDQGESTNKGATGADAQGYAPPGDAEGALRAEGAAGSEGKADARAPGGKADSGKPESDGDLRTDQLAQRKIIRTAELVVRVEDVSRALATVRSAAESVGGIVGEESTERDDDGREQSEVVLRVPQEKYDDVLEKLGDTGTVLRRNTGAEDVTEQVVDVETRLKNQRASVARIRELMDEATKISDVVALEGELSSRQADLESLLAQQTSLKDRTTLATITLSLTERPDAGRDEESGFLDSVGDGWGAFVATLRWLSIVLGAALPFLALAGALYAVWRWLLGPWVRRRRPVPPAGPAAGGAVSATGAVGPAAPATVPPTPRAPDAG
ncbi:DUF4349 domain-containing protein [Streptomyces sp. NPDC059578]|uniref:DUF4349 domain-containing protein n=1 Tax=unclassified Streptomyces TaxID=2593676 RepID=UPI0036693CF0